MVNYRQNVSFQDLGTMGKPWITIEQPTTIEIREGIDSVIDTFNIKIADKVLPLGYTFEDQDNVHICLGSISTPTTVNFDGLMTDMTCDFTENGKIWSVKGNNRFEYLFGRQTPTHFTNTTAFSACSLLIAQTNDANSANPNWVSIGWDSNNTITNGSFNFYRGYKPVYQHIEELSKDSFTGQGQFVYYIDKNGKFVFKTRPMNITGSLVEGFEFTGNKSQKSSFDTVNAAIINAGNDFNGKPIYRYVLNLQGIGKNGFKWKYYEDVKLAEELKVQNNVTINTMSSWGRASDFTGGNQAFRDLIGSQVNFKWKSVIEKLGLPRWKSDIDVRGTYNHVLGDKYNIISPYLGWVTGRELRLTERIQTFDQNGWETRLHLEEDEQTV